MNYAALIFCPDEKTTRVLTQVLNDVEFTVEPCTEAFAAVKKLMAQRFDAVVVDCDNDQNAALMFKSVRNSEMNQAALTVAVVGDQAGVAKAFRLGANLVLTKPINVEQAKGTLRVARGLLKKGEAPKTTTSTPSVVAPSAPAAQKPAQPVTRAESAPVQTFAAKPAIHIPQPPPAPAKAVPAIAASALELEPEPLPAATPDDAALLESMPTPVNPLKNSWPAASETKISKPAPAFSDAHASSGAAAAPAREVAPAKEATPVKAIEPEVKPAEHKAAATVFNLPKTEESAPEVSHTQDFATAKITHSDAPMFSSISGSADADASGDGSGKKIGIIAVAVLALAAVGYFVVSKSHHPTAAPAQQSSQASPAASQSAPIPTATPNSQSSALTSTTSTKPAAQVSSQISNTQPAKPSSNTSPEKSADKTDKTSEKSEKSSASAKNSEAAAEVAPLLVKNEAPQPPPAPVAETPAPEAPSMDVAASDASKNALSGIVSSVPANVPKPSGQAIKVSQGVSQGLLIKRVNPTYPPQAMSARIQGSVLLDAHIGKDGSITSVKTLSGDAVLAGAATDAVKQWKYKPYYLDGQAIDIETQITVNFKLP